VATLPLMDLCEELDALLLADAALVYATHAALLEFLVDDGVFLSSTLDLPGHDLLLWKLVADEVVEERLRPVGHLPDGEDHHYGRLGRSPQGRMQHSGWDVAGSPQVQLRGAGWCASGSPRDQLRHSD
jgi:hypothetical protein